MRTRRTLLITALLLVTPLLFAQNSPYGVLEYYGDDLELAIYDEDDFEVNFFLGMDLSPGDRIVTENTTVEIRLEPNGSIMKIGENTSFTVEAIQGRNEALTNRFAVSQGKLRTVAARVAGAEYEVRLPGAVAGVRGTDFVVEVAEGVRNALTVLDGSVTFSKPASGQALEIGAGERGEALAEQFAVSRVPEAELQQLAEELRFEALDPASVPTGEEPEDTTEAEEEPTEAEEAPAEGEAAAAEEEARFLSNLGEFLGLQIGSVTMNDQTYGEAVLTPAFEAGKLKAAFYLPVVYQEDLFDPGTWYRPGGNNEWSFGFDKGWTDDPIDAAADFGRDVALKIRYIQWGEQRDPFFFKVGNIPSITLGHGLLMYKYSNNVDFPAIRKVGLNLGLDREAWGFEGVINDLTRPAIYGGRLYFRPARPLSNAAVGLSALTDLKPTDELSSTRPDGTSLPGGLDALYDATRESDLYFLNLGMDLDVPIVEGDIFSLVAFGDVGGMIPYVREGAGGVGSGVKFDALVDLESSELKNFGLASGVLGKIAMVDYRLEYRRYDGTFRYGFYGPNYDRLRGNYAVETLAYLDDPDSELFDVTTMGIYGEAGFDILELLRFEAGYFWPWQVTSDGNWEGSDRDELNVSATIQEGLLPLGITASFGYRRTFFIPTLLGKSDFEEATLFDANTVASATVTYPVASNLDLIASVYATVNRDGDGDIVYDDDGGPKVSPTVVIQTKIGF